MKTKRKDRALGFYLALTAAVLALAGLAVYIIYIARGGEADIAAIVCSALAVLCPLIYVFYEGKLSVIPAVLLPVFCIAAFGLTLGGGAGNIADAVQGIHLFGDASLVPLNYTMAALYGAGSAAGIAAAFFPRCRQA